MSKSKKTTYLLLIVVADIWGSVFYKLFSGLAGEDVVLQNTIPFSALPPGSGPDTFQLLANYRDPFLGKSSPAIKTGPVKPIKKPEVKTQSPSPVPWPSIVYSGMVKNDKSNKLLALLQVNGSSQALKQGDKIENVEVVQIFRDSILLKQGKEKKIFKKGMP